jgi:hypothetical protein
VLAFEGDERRGRRDAGLSGEDRRRRVLEPADAEGAIDEADRPVATCDPPVPFAHVADEDRVELEVHRVHLAEVSVADQCVARADERRRVGVALRTVTVSLGHQVGRGEERQLLEAAVASDGLEMHRETVVAALREDFPQGELEPDGVLVALGPEVGVDRELRPVLFAHCFDRVGSHGLHLLVDIAEVLVDDRRPDLAQQRRRVVEDVLHAVHGVAEEGDLRPPQLGHRPRRSRPCLERGEELRRTPLVGDHRVRQSCSQQRVRLILRSVDSLVVREVVHRPRRAHDRLRLNVREQQRKRILL